MIHFFAHTFLVALYSSSVVKSAPNLQIKDAKFDSGKLAIPSTADSAAPELPTLSSQLMSYDSTSSRRQVYPTSSRTHDTGKPQNGTSSGSSYGDEAALSSQHGASARANGISSFSRYGLQENEGAGTLQSLSNQGCSHGTPVTTTQTVTTVVTSTQAVTTTESSVVTRTSSATTTITAYVTTTVTSTGGLNTGHPGQMQGAGSSVPSANIPTNPDTTGQHGTVSPNNAQPSSNPYGSAGHPQGSLPTTKAGGLSSYPMASATQGTGQPGSANYGYGSAAPHPTTTGNGNIDGPAISGTGHGGLAQSSSLTSLEAGGATTSKPNKPYYPPISPNSTFQQLGPTASGDTPVTSNRDSGASLTTTPISSTLLPPAKPLDTSNSSHPASGTIASAPVPTTCSSPSTSTISVFFEGLRNTSLPTPYFYLNYSTFTPTGSPPNEYILSPQPPHLLSIPTTPDSKADPKAAHAAISFTPRNLTVSCSPLPANISCTVNIWGVQIPHITASGAAAGGLAEMSILVPAAATHSGEKGSGNGTEVPLEGEGAAVKGVGVPVNFMGEGWLGLKSLAFEAKINGPWGTGDGRTGVGLDNVVYEVLTCPV